jgi:hypothetical protein
MLMKEKVHYILNITPKFVVKQSTNWD